MARWALLILGFLCLVPAVGGGLLWLIAEVWNRFARNNPNSPLVDVGLKAEFGWGPIVIATVIGITLVVLGFRMPSAKIRS